MKTISKFELEQELKTLWEKRDSLSSEDFSKEADRLYARFEMRIEDLISHLLEIRERHGNIKVLKEEINAGTLHLVNIHVQQRNDTDGEWVLSIY